MTDDVAARDTLFQLQAGERKKQETRGRILTSARKMLEKLGFDATTLEQVAEDADVAAAYLSASVFCKYLGNVNNQFPRDNGLLTSAAMTLIKSIGIVDKNTPDWKPVSSKLEQSFDSK